MLKLTKKEINWPEVKKKLFSTRMFQIYLKRKIKANFLAKHIYSKY